MTSAARMRSVEILGFVSTSVATTHMWQSLGIFSPESPYISFRFRFITKFLSFHLIFRSFFMTNTVAVIVVSIVGNLLTLIAVPYVRLK